MTTTPIPDSHRDLLEAPVVAVLSTLGADGYIQATAVWVVLDGDVLKTSLLDTRQKYRNMARHPHATMFLVDPENPFRTLEVRGDVSFSDDPGMALMERSVTKYGSSMADFPPPYDHRVVLTLTPRRVVTFG